MKKILLFLSFLLMSIGVWGASWQLNPSDFSGSSYDANDGDHTKDGITYNTYNVMLSSSSIQLKKNSGLIYNKTAFSGNITKITADGGLTIKVGTSQNPSSGTTVTSGSTISGNYTYFWIKNNTGGVVRISSIIIEYSNAPEESCDSVTVTLYASHGSASLSKTKICKKESVEVTNIVPDEGYELDTIACMDENGNDVGVINQTTHIISGINKNCYVLVNFKEILEPDIDIVEWNPDYIKIDIDNFEGAVTAVVENKNTQLNMENFADSVFFSKYFEAASNVKLLGIYNGTNHTVNLSEYQIWTDDGDASGWSGHKSINELFKLYSVDSLRAILEPGSELILMGFQNIVADSAIINCAIEDEESNYGTYIRLGQWLAFNGDDAIALVNPGGELIDLIGAGTKSGGRCLTGGDVVTTSSNNGDVNGFMDKPGGWYTEKGYKSNLDHTEEANYKLSSNRCLLIRRKHVKNGLSAVQRNTTKFLTLGDYTYNNIKYEGEWKGIQIPGKTSEGGASASCDGFKQVGSYDYNNYYATYTQVGDEITLSSILQSDGTYKIDIEDLDTLSCTLLKVIVSNGEDKKEEEYQIPIFVNSPVFSNNILFTQEGDDCPTCDVVIIDGGQLTINPNLQNRNITVYPGGRLIIPSGQTYTLKSLTLRRDNNDLPYLLNNGTVVLDNDSNYFFDLRTDGDDWRWMTLPNSHKVSDIKLPKGGVLNENVWVSYYDGNYRAHKRFNAWKDVGNDGVADTIFNAGEGFLFGVSLPGKSKKIYRFTFPNTSINSEKQNKTIRNLYAWGGTDPTITENNKGWNLIGNPFTDNDTTDIIDPIRVGRLVKTNTIPWDGKWEVDSSEVRNGKKLRYAVLPVFDARKDTVADIIAAGGYESVVLDDYVLKPFTSFFVQLGGDSSINQTITFDSIVSVISNPNRIVARSPQYDEDKELFLRVKVGDRKTGCFISNNFTDAYEPGDDLESRYQIYQLINGYKLLYSAINDSIIEHGVRVFTPFGNLHLDPKTNINDFSEIYALYNDNWIDLLHGETADVDGNFILYAKRKKDIDISTDIDIIKSNNMTIKFIQNNNLYIKKNDHIYNILGGIIK